MEPRAELGLELPESGLLGGGGGGGGGGGAPNADVGVKPNFPGGGGGGGAAAAAEVVEVEAVEVVVLLRLQQPRVMQSGLGPFDHV